MYDQIEKENKDNKRSSLNQKQPPKNSSAEPVIRGHQSQQSHALILVVEQIGAGACHTGRNSCFYRKVVPGSPAALKFTQDGLSFDPNAVYGK